jgi:hypothetical protein
MNYEHFKLAAAVADDAILYGACRCFCHRIRHIRRRLYQDFMAEPGASTALFPKPNRPVADTISPIWHDEKARDAAGEPSQ